MEEEIKQKANVYGILKTVEFIEEYYKDVIPESIYQNLINQYVEKYEKIRNKHKITIDQLNNYVKIDQIKKM